MYWDSNQWYFKGEFPITQRPCVELDHYDLSSLDSQTEPNEEGILGTL